MPVKLIAYIIGGILTLGVGWKVYDVVRDYFINTKNTQQLLTNELIAHERTQGELLSIRTANLLYELHKEAIADLREEYEEEMTGIRNQAEFEKQVLIDRERLQRVSVAKPVLVAKLANRATEKVFNDLETIFNN